MFRPFFRLGLGKHHDFWFTKKGETACFSDLMVSSLEFYTGNHGTGKAVFQLHGFHVDLWFIQFWRSSNRPWHVKQILIWFTKGTGARSIEIIIPHMRCLIIFPIRCLIIINHPKWSLTKGTQMWCFVWSFSFIFPMKMTINCRNQDHQNQTQPLLISPIGLIGLIGYKIYPYTYCNKLTHIIHILYYIIVLIYYIIYILYCIILYYIALYYIILYYIIFQTFPIISP